MAERKVRTITFSRQVLDRLTNHGQEHRERMERHIRTIMENPYPEDPLVRIPAPIIREADVEGFSQLVGQRMIGSFVEVEPTRFVPTSYYMVFLYTAEKLLYLQDVDVQEIQKLGIPRYVESKQQRIASYQNLDLTFDGAYEQDDGIIVRLKSGNSVGELHAKFYTLGNVPQQSKPEEKGE